MTEEKLTPLMTQYFSIKSQYSDALLFFQVGDFFELFFDDAVSASAFLAITLTKRGKCKGQDIPLCGIPVQSLTYYLSKLVKGGFKVVVCEQLSAPIPGQVVERGVTQIFTPGTLVDSQLLDEKNPSYLFSIYPEKDRWGVIVSELLTAQIFATTIPAGAYKSLESELSRFFPDEVILPSMNESKTFQTYFKQLGYWVSIVNKIEVIKEPEDLVGESFSKAWFEAQFGSVAASKIFENRSILNTLVLFYSYLKDTQKLALDQFKTIQFYDPDDYLVLDFSTQRNLEIVANSQNGTRINTLFSVMDRAKTAMGSRTIKKWLMRPLIQKRAIIQRQEIVNSFKSSIETLQNLENVLSQIPDAERIVGRIGLKKASLQDYLGLKTTLSKTNELKSIIKKHFDCELIRLIYDRLGEFSKVLNLLEISLNDESEFNFIIKNGFDSELDHVRNLVTNAHKAILDLEKKEIEKTGINSLKIRYNSVSGYSIEITKTHLQSVPSNYIRQQTLTNRERYVTKELMDLEREIIKANNEINIVENRVYEKIKNFIDLHLAELRHLSQAVAYLDALYSFSNVAYNNNYIIPSFNDSRNIIINSGRHPVVEQSLKSHFVANSTNLVDEESLWIITGPNMGGKSTYLRQVAQICILAQCGSFVPAKSASLPILDRIFTRIGSGDLLAEGKSTFLVEMEETATICNLATKDSLVILDEVGRGTSTYDGLAIAQSVIEYINKKIGARCLFATHYHELTKLKQQYNSIANYHMVCRKTDKGIIFLHKIEQGVALGSFGLEVAKLAALPHEIIVRAKSILNELEKISSQDSYIAATKSDNNSDLISLHEKIKVLEECLKNSETVLLTLKNLNFDELSPRKAFDLLWSLKALK